jgi:hypothetical protein
VYLLRWQCGTGFQPVSCFYKTQAESVAVNFQRLFGEMKAKSAGAVNDKGLGFGRLKPEFRNQNGESNQNDE